MAENEKKYIWNAIEWNNAKVINASDKTYEWIGDPVGYFLIRINTETQEIEVGICEYDSPNEIKILVKGGLPQQIYERVIDEGLVSRMDHAAYLGKEIEKAKNNLIIVEGRKDKAALQQLGFTDIFVINETGKSLSETIEEIEGIAAQNKNKVCILTDLTRKARKFI